MLCKRYKRFKEHYKIIRSSDEKGDAPETTLQFLLSQWPLGYKHSKSMWNCAYWAWKNSGTHNPDGSYLT